MMMNSGAKEAKAKERAALARQRVRGIGFATGAAAAALASAFFIFAEPAKAGEAQVVNFAVAEIQKTELAEASRGKLLLVVSPDVPKPVQERFLRNLQEKGLSNLDVKEDASLESKHCQIYVNGGLLQITLAGSEPATKFIFGKLPSTMAYIMDYLKQKEVSLLGPTASL